LDINTISGKMAAITISSAIQIGRKVTLKYLFEVNSLNSLWSK
jgi:hypothetical protein